MDDTVITLSPALQWGFAGFSLILVGVIVWLIKCLLQVLKDTIRSLDGNTQALREVHQTADATRLTLASMRDELLRAKCPLAKDTKDRQTNG